MKNWFKSLFQRKQTLPVDKLTDLTMRHAKWTPDCQGKQDFDFPLVHVSCRMYPPRYQQLTHQNMWHCVVNLFQYTEANSHSEYVTLFTVDVYGKTEDETKAAVQAEVREALKRLTQMTFAEFQPDESEVQKAITSAERYAP